MPIRIPDSIAERAWNNRKVDLDANPTGMMVALETSGYAPKFGRFVAWYNYPAHSLPWNRPPKPVRRK